MGYTSLKEKSLMESWLDYPDSMSLALVAYFPGCSHGCLGCHNIEMQREIPENDRYCMMDILSNYIPFKLSRLHTNKLVISGGDPLHPSNINYLKLFITKLSSTVDICVYTGYDKEYVIENGISGFKFIKCGRYEADKRLSSAGTKTNTELHLASSNQIMYDANFIPISKNGIVNI